MPVVNCPIDIPEGWEFVRYGVPSSGETFLDEDGDPVSSDVGCVYPWVIIRRARPAIEVGDWVKLNWELSTFHGAAGQVRAMTIQASCLVEMDSSNGASVFVDRGRLIKQSRTIEPYTMDQCIAESSKRGRHVQLGSKSTLIESIHIAGVTLSCPSIGFVSYVEAAESLAWAGGEAFGVETWRDAE